MSSFDCCETVSQGRRAGSPIIPGRASVFDALLEKLKSLKKLKNLVQEILRKLK